MLKLFSNIPSMNFQSIIIASVILNNIIEYLVFLSIILKTIVYSLFLCLNKIITVS